MPVGRRFGKRDAPRLRLFSRVRRCRIAFSYATDVIVGLSLDTGFSRGDSLTTPSSSNLKMAVSR